MTKFDQKPKSLEQHLQEKSRTMLEECVGFDIPILRETSEPRNITIDNAKEAVKEWLQEHRKVNISIMEGMKYPELLGGKYHYEGKVAEDTELLEDLEQE